MIPCFPLLPPLAVVPGPEPVPSPAPSMDLGEILQFELVGFIIVIGTLAALWLVCEAIGLWFKRAARRAAAAEPAAATEVEQPSPILPVVAITAAVAAVCQRRGRIVSIRPTNQLWSHVGRREHFQSHRIR